MSLQQSPSAAARATTARARHAVRAEVLALSRLAAPMIPAQVGWMMLGLVDMWMVGKLGSAPLAAVALGDLWVFGTLMMAQGVMMGLDPIVAQAHGAGDGARGGQALQRGLVLAMVLSVPLTLAWLVTGPVLRLAGQDPVLAAQAHAYVVAQVFCVAPFLAFIALRQYLQARGIMVPGLAVVIGANLVNFVLDWLLIFGRGGFPALGIVGSAIATGVTRVLMLVAMAAIIALLGLHRGAWVPWSRAALQLGGLRELVRIGLPIGFTIGFEIWAFSLAGIFAGWLGPGALAAHTVVLKVSALSFMVPLGISVAAATRVGNLVGARDHAGARRAGWVALALGGGVMLVSAVLMLVFRDAIPRLFLGEAEVAVITAAAAVFPVAAAFQLFDGVQVVGAGVLRGRGRTREAAVANFAGYYVFALPFGAWLAFASWPRLELVGIWIGLAVGLASVATLLTLRIQKAGHTDPDVGTA